jgi:hypothetical protein
MDPAPGDGATAGDGEPAAGIRASDAIHIRAFSLPGGPGSTGQGRPASAKTRRGVTDGLAVPPAS